MIKYEFKDVLPHLIWYTSGRFIGVTKIYSDFCCIAHSMQHLQALGIEVLTQDLVICLILVNELNTDFM